MLGSALDRARKQRAQAWQDLQVHQFPTRSDNYGVLIHDPETEATASIDAPDAEELLAALHEKGWVLTHILITHHHHDHTAGNTIVKRMTGCTIVGPAKEAGSIPGIDVEVKEGDTVEIGGAKGRVIETPGHTKGHVSYYLPRRQARVCRRHAVLGRLRQAARGRRQDDVGQLAKARCAAARDHALLRPRIYRQELPLRADRRAGERCAQARAAEVAALAEEGEPALPTTIAQELATNPFLRPSSPAIQKRLGMEGASRWPRSSARSQRKDVIADRISLLEVAWMPGQARP